MSVVTEKQNLIVVPLTSKQSVLVDPEFQNVKNTAADWLQKEGVAGYEMDSVNFSPDRFELMVDTRGYRPEDIKCTVGSQSIEVIAKRLEVSGGTQRNMETSRCYQLPQLILPQQAICCISTEGILLVAVPWQK